MTSTLLILKYHLNRTWNVSDVRQRRQHIEVPEGSNQQTNHQENNYPFSIWPPIFLPGCWGLCNIATPITRQVPPCTSTWMCPSWAGCKALADKPSIKVAVIHLPSSKLATYKMMLPWGRRSSHPCMPSTHSSWGGHPLLQCLALAGKCCTPQNYCIPVT